LPNAGASGSAIGDMMVSVAVGLFGTTRRVEAFMLVGVHSVPRVDRTNVSASVTGARVTYAMGRDDECRRTWFVERQEPLTVCAIWTLAGISAVLGIVTGQGTIGAHDAGGVDPKYHNIGTVRISNPRPSQTCHITLV